MADIKLKIDGDATGALRAINKTDNAVKAFGNKITGGVFKGNIASNLATKGAELVMSAIANLAERAIKLDKTLVEVRQSIGATGAQTKSFGDQAIKAGIATSNSTEEMLDLGKGAVGTSRDIDWVTSSLGVLGDLYAKVGGDASTFGGIAGKLHQEFGMGSTEIADYIANLYNVGNKYGEKGLSDILPSADAFDELIDRVQNYYNGKATTKNISDVIAAGMVTGSADGALKMISKLNSDPKTRSILKAYGIKFVDKNGGKKDAMSLLTDIGKLVDDPRFAKDKGVLERALFGRQGSEEAQKLFRQLVDIKKANEDITGAGDLSNAKAGSITGSINRMSGLTNDLASKTMTPFFEGLSAAINGINQQELDAFADTFSALGTSLGFIISMISKLNNVLTGAAKMMVPGLVTMKNTNRTVEAGEQLTGQAKYNYFKLQESLAQKAYDDYTKNYVGSSDIQSVRDEQQAKKNALEWFKSLAGIASFAPGVQVNNYIDGVKVPSKRTTTFVNPTASVGPPTGASKIWNPSFQK